MLFIPDLPNFLNDALVLLSIDGKFVPEIVFKFFCYYLDILAYVCFTFLGEFYLSLELMIFFLEFYSFFLKLFSILFSWPFLGEKYCELTFEVLCVLGV